MLANLSLALMATLVIQAIKQPPAAQLNVVCAN
jgi:hypothetical protein